jgi:hypothetical protein
VRHIIEGAGLPLPTISINSGHGSHCYWLDGFAEYKGGRGSDTGHWLAMWSGSPLTVDRKTGSKPTIHIPRAMVDIVGGVQPGILRRAIGREHMQDGLCARLLLAMPDQRPVRWSEATVSPETEAALTQVFDRLLALAPGTDEEGNPTPFPMPLTAQAKEAWVQYYNLHRAELLGLDDELAAAWVKLEAYAARLALIVQLCRWAAGEATDEAVDKASIQAGITLADWFGNEARRGYRMLAESEQDREQRELIELVQRKGGAVTPRELMRTPPRRYRTADDAESALNALVKANRGRWEIDNHGGGRGQPTQRMRLTDAVDADTNSAKHEENGITVNGNSVNGV